MKIIISRIFRFLLVSAIISLIVTTYITGNTVFKRSMQLTDNIRSSRKKVQQYIESKHIIDYDSFLLHHVVIPIALKSTIDKHTIPGFFISNDSLVNKKSVVMVHGLGGNSLTCFPRAKLFLDKGYNVYVYDQRNSGDNHARYTTYGALESKDLKDYVKFARSRMSQDKSLLIWGVSFGGATVGNALADKELQQLVDTAIMECPLSGIRDMLRKSLKNPHRTAPSVLPDWYIIEAGNLVTWLRLGFSYSDTDVAHNIRETSVPCVIFNSRTDKVTPYEMGKKIYDAIKNTQKKLITVDSCAHANIYYKYPKLYKKGLWGE